jgi:hypothetical protein
MKNGSNVIIVKQLESRITLSLSLGTSKQKAKTVYNSNLLWLNIPIYNIIRIECILLKFHWGMKALIELHFQHENVLRSTLSYPNKTDGHDITEILLEVASSTINQSEDSECR